MAPSLYIGNSSPNSDFTDIEWGAADRSTLMLSSSA